MTATVNILDLITTVICPKCHVGVGARCITRSGKPAGQPHDSRFDAVEQVAGLTQHRAEQARARNGWSIRDHKAEETLLVAYAARVARKEIGRKSDELLATAWLLTETLPMSEELAVTRRWLMDELETRMGGDKFEAWLFTDGDAVDPLPYLR